MSAVSAPFGFRPSFHPVGFDRAARVPIAPGYATGILKGQAVTLNTNGTITAAVAATDIIGIFAGCEYVDPTGKPNESPNWPAAQAVLAGTTPYAYVYTNPLNVYEVQADGPIAATAIGDQADVTNAAAGSTVTGQSAATLASALSGVGVQGQFRIVGFSLSQDNAPGDAFTVVQVQIARHQFVANKVAI